ncbi:hypothetical protein DCAR_0625593 [Daucus carota subsp. sativus]|uniref:Uncharacterized protein n=1 Tax=Daucus carota subsp. sativus TaxID=79200 RepID=A0A161WTH9_DAUCS|nr:hypothetical protein DCAR_0625593 [Daucus carota subsp. sativus]
MALASGENVEEHEIRAYEEGLIGDMLEKEEDEEELFEINLDVMEKMPGSLRHNYSENDTNYSPAKSSSSASKLALLANCLLPVSDLSCAVPMAPRLTGSRDIIIVAAADSIYILPKLLHVLF